MIKSGHGKIKIAFVNENFNQFHLDKWFNESDKTGDYSNCEICLHDWFEIKFVDNCPKWENGSIINGYVEYSIYYEMCHNIQCHKEVVNGFKRQFPIVDILDHSYSDTENEDFDLDEFNENLSVNDFDSH